MTALRVVVLSDTHGPRFWKTMPPAVAEQLSGADMILHVGDVCTPSVLEEIAALGPLRVVRGNNDGPDIAAWGAPDILELDVGGLHVAMIHDAGNKIGRLARMRRRFPDADLVVFGHSHIPLDESDGYLRIFNPGSPTDKRRQPRGTVGQLVIEGGSLVSATIVPVT